MRFVNLFVRAVLQSPLHAGLSDSILLIVCRGRRSGRTLRIPVRYTCSDRGIEAYTARANTWWHNLEDGAGIDLVLAGVTRRASARLLTEVDDDFIEALRTHVTAFPQDARFFPIRLDAAGRPESGEIERAARTHVRIRFTLAN